MRKASCFALSLSILGSGLAMAAAPDEPSKPATALSRPTAKMKMDEPMAGQMAKDGQPKGDVRKEAERKFRTMQPMMEAEEKAMPTGPKP